MLTWSEQLAMATHQLAACSIVSCSWPASSPVCCKAHFAKIPPRPVSRFITRASSSTEDAATEVGNGDGQEEEVESQQREEEDNFEERLAKLRRRVNSGTGTKAAKRKARQAGDYTPLASSSPKGKGRAMDVLLPPISLKDPVSDGLPVALGFNSYTERINGRFAALGLAAFLLVELATGSSFLKYHESSVIALQVYTMLAASAIFIKYEKEKISIWPGPKG